MSKFAPQSLELAISNKCNIMCRHCHSDSDAQKTLLLEDTEFDLLVTSAKESGVKFASLIGGEIFLFPDRISTLIKKLHENGLWVCIYSNGFWGKSKAAAENAINMLVEAGWKAGSDKLFISTGKFHQEWLPTTTIKTAITAYYAKFKSPVYIDLSDVPNNNALAVLLTKFSNLPPLSFTVAKVRTVYYRFGRDTPLTEDESGVARHWSTFGKCDIVNRISLHADGSVYPCCGYNYNSPGLAITKITPTMTAADVIDAANSSPVITNLMNKSLSEMYAPLKEGDPSLPDKVTSICEICEIVCNSK